MTNASLVATIAQNLGNGLGRPQLLQFGHVIVVKAHNAPLTCRASFLALALLWLWQNFVAQ